MRYAVKFLNGRRHEIAHVDADSFSEAVTKAISQLDATKPVISAGVDAGRKTVFDYIAKKCHHCGRFLTKWDMAVANYDLLEDCRQCMEAGLIIHDLEGDHD